MKAIAKWRYRAEEKMFVGEETPRYFKWWLKEAREDTEDKVTEEKIVTGGGRGICKTGSIVNKSIEVGWPLNFK